MILRPRILLVGPSAVRPLVPTLASAGYEPTAVGDFGSAKACLDKRPDLLITELKLGAYNGLHLAIRASRNRIPTIVIGDPDPVLSADAERQQAVYLVAPIDPDAVVELVGQMLQGARLARRSVRKLVPSVNAFVNEIPAQLRDVSYEGMCIEATQRDLPSQYFDVRLPQFNFTCRAQRVWSAPSGEDGTGICCGAALSTDGETASSWRAIVDIMPGLAVIG